MSFKITFYLLFGIVSACVGAYLLFIYFITKFRSTPIKGIVDGYEESRDNRGNSIYNPLIKFEYNGETLIKPTDFFDKKKCFEIGQEIEIFILHNKDYVMRAAGGNSIKNGLIFLVVGIVLIIYYIMKTL